MSAEKTIGKGTGGNRSVLKDILPLEIPLGVYIFPIYACNFKCKYCLCSVEHDDRGLQFEKNVMDLSLFKKCVDDIAEMNGRLKMFRFAGIGEPLLHKDIAEMVRYAVDRKISENVEIITNASMLTKELSDKLLKAGLTKLFISIQGLDSTTYRDISEVDIDFYQFYDNIKYFYDNKGKTKLHIKILDCSLKDSDDENKFYNLFGNMCDTITIEKVAPLASKVNYSSLINEEELLTIRGRKFEDIDICPFPFYLMQINPDGTVIPCCSAETIATIGDCNMSSIKDIWNGSKFNEFRKKMLDGCKTFNVNHACSTCTAYKYSMFEEDKIYSTDVQRLKELY